VCAYVATASKNQKKKLKSKLKLPENLRCAKIATKVVDVSVEAVDGPYNGDDSRLLFDCEWNSLGVRMK
jgi:hypothetical protein